MRRAGRLLLTVVHLVTWFFSTILRAVFGQVRWEPPRWLAAPFRVAVRGSRRTAARAGELRRKRPSVFYGASAGVLLFFVAGVFGYRYWKSLPEPVRLSVAVSAPPLQAIREDIKPAPITVTFSGSAARLEDVGKPVDKGIELDPPLPGKWEFKSDRALEFTPASDWAIGTTYKVRLEKRLFPRHVLLQSYDATFTTPAFDARIERAEFYQDPTDAKRKLIALTIAFSHPVDRKSLEGAVKITRPERRRDKSENGPGKNEYAAKVTYDALDAKAFISSEDIPLPERDVELDVKVGPGLKAARGSAETKELTSTLVVPAIGSFFKITNAAASYVRRDESGELVPILSIGMTGRVAPKVLEKRVEAWILPRDKPAEKKDPKSKPIENYKWYAASEVGPEILALGKKLSVVLDGDQGSDPLQAAAFRHAAKPGDQLYVRIERGLEAFGGYVLADTWQTVVTVPPIPTELKILHPGAILSMQGEKKLTLVSRGVPGVRARLGRVAPERINMLVSQTMGSFSSLAFKNYRFGKDDLVERFEERHVLDASDPAKPQYYGLDLGPYLTRPSGAQQSSAKKGLFFVDVDEWNPAAPDAGKKDESFDPNTAGRDARFVLVTDLGLVVKDTADGAHEVFVMRLRDGVPAGGVDVAVLGRNGIPVVSRTTDADGRASFPSLSGFRYQEEPVAWVARAGDDVSFLPFGRDDRRLYLGRFEIGGETTAGKPEALDAYVFSDRGLYRPGDTARLGTIVKAYGFAPLPAGLPLELVITDPRGLEISRRTFSPGKDGFDEHSFATEPGSPTGAYEVALYTVKDENRGSLLGTTSIKVEEFLPDRLKIVTTLSKSSDAGWVKPDGLTAAVSLKNLYGTPAVGHRIAATYALQPASPRLPGYETWTFLPLDQATEAREEALGDGETDADGRKVFELPLEQFAGKTYRLTVTAEGFELAGGRAVVGRAATVISARDYVIGVKPDGELGWVRQGTDRRVALIALGPDAQPVVADGLSAVLSERRWVSTLVKGDDGLFRYRSTQIISPLSTENLAIPAAGFTYKVPSAKAGSYVYEVKNARAEVLATFAFEVAGSGAMARGLERNAELEVRVAKSDAAPGEDIELEIKAPYTGAGLITIERDKVYAAKWFKTEDATSIQKITLPEGVEGNAYVHVAFVRGPDSRELYASPLSYGVVPITVSRARRTVALELKVPEKTRPQDPLTVDVKPDRATRMVVFGVDEGILAVARYKTPDPLSRFLRKRALEVTTRQILDQLLPEYSVALKAAAGGDGDDGLAKNLNPFRRKTLAPAVFWSGIVDVGPEGKHFTFDLPSHFNGTVRVMAVAVAPDAIGAAEQRALRQGPFVLAPVAPLFVAPGDEFSASVAVANNVVGSGKAADVQVTVAPKGGLRIVGEPVQTLKIDEGREGVASFRFKAAPELGEAKLGFLAKRGADEVGYEETLSVRPGTPYEVQIAAERIDSGTESFKIERGLHGAFRKLEATASLLPLGLARGLVAYLEGYPHGCTEQVLSQSFPAVILAQFPGFDLPADKGAATVAHAIDILRARQNADGSIGYWAANADVVPFQQAYAAHFLLDVREKKLGVVDAPLERLEAYMIRATANADPRSSVAAARDIAYMAYTLALDGKLSANALAALRDTFQKNLPETWVADPTAAFLAAAMKLRRDDDAALKMFKKVTLDGESTKDTGFYFDEYLRAAEILYIAARHFPERLGEVEAQAAARLVDLVVHDRYNTLTSAWAIKSLEAYAKATGSPQDAGVTITAVDKAGNKTPLPLGDLAFPIVSFDPAARRIDVDTGNAKVPVFAAVTTAGFDLEGTRKPEEKGIEVFREITDAKGKVVDAVTVGDEVTVTLAIRGIDATRDNVAIVDLLPGGFELVFESFAGHGRAAPGEEASPEGTQEENQEVSPPPGEEEQATPSGEDDGEASMRKWWRHAGRVYAAGAAGSAPPFVPMHLDLREDRVVIYGQALDHVQAFSYKIRATAPGTYLVPAPYAHSMYDRDVRTRGKQGTIKIEAK